MCSDSLNFGGEDTFFCYLPDFQLYVIWWSALTHDLSVSEGTPLLDCAKTCVLRLSVSSLLLFGETRHTCIC